jgi:hypothetical protein
MWREFAHGQSGHREIAGFLPVASLGGVDALTWDVCGRAPAGWTACHMRLPVKVLFRLPNWT